MRASARASGAFRVAAARAVAAAFFCAVGLAVATTSGAGAARAQSVGTQAAPTSPQNPTADAAAPTAGPRAGDLTALARFEPAGSEVVDREGGLHIVLKLSQPVPYRVSPMADPPRLVFDFREVDWSALGRAALVHSSRVRDLRAGTLAPGWSRLVLKLDGPYRIARAYMRTEGEAGAAQVVVDLLPTDGADFAHAAEQAQADLRQADLARLWRLPRVASTPAAPAKRRQDGSKPLVVVLDPGHGGIDPGSVYGHVHEADVTLAFARQLRELLIRAGMQVIMTRTEDAFVPLETRLSIARAAGADLFLSIHADAEHSHEATGATVYTLARKASDKASAELAARHNRDDIMAGVDLTHTDDQIAMILMDMARTETLPRSVHFADALVAAIKGAHLRMHIHPHQVAAFSVLKSPDVPSALIELGYLSSPRDRKNLVDPAWRERMARAITAAIEAWAKADAAQAALVRQ